MSYRIYSGGNILTAESDVPTADYLIAEKGRIVAVGQGEPPAIAKAEKISLRGKTLIPAFIDAHSHFSGCAVRLLQVSLAECRSIEDIVRTVRNFIRERKPKNREWIFAADFDETDFSDRRPTAKDLDDAAPSHPLVVQYRSGHMGIFNSAGLRFLDVNADMPPSEGGFIEKDEDGNPTGYMEENDFVSRLSRIPSPMPDRLTETLLSAQKIYFSYGITTAQEGFAGKELLPILKMFSDSEESRLDVVAYSPPADYDAYADVFEKQSTGGRECVRIGGIKIILDGSPQSRTAWLREPYRQSVKEERNGRPTQKRDCGYPSMSREEVENAVRFATKRRLQLLAHCNGDAAAQRFIDAQSAYGDPALRPVMIHAQLLGRDQFPAMKKAGIIPSFFVSHIYYWGETHIKNLGEKRASVISPLHSASENDILFTLHQDAPVIRPDMTETIWSAVARETKKTHILGKDERIAPFAALRAVTINAAYQYFREKEIGSLAKGKREDLVFLSENPLRTPTSRIKDIRVVQTIKNGETVYRA